MQLTFDLSGFALLVVVIGIFVQVLKMTEYIPTRFSPLLSLIIGGIVGFVFVPLLDGATQLMAIIQGVIAGAMASGVYDFAKKSILNK